MKALAWTVLVFTIISLFGMDYKSDYIIYALIYATLIIGFCIFYLVERNAVDKMIKENSFKQVVEEMIEKENNRK